MILMIGLLVAGLFPTGAMAVEKRGWLASATNQAVKRIASDQVITRMSGTGSQPVEEPAQQPAPEPVTQPVPEPGTQPDADQGTQPAPNPAPEPVKTVYAVQKGDSLYLIGKKFGVTAAAIKTANQLPGDSIYPGQRLVIPVLSVAVDPVPEAALYTVRRGDSLYLISKRFATSVYRIKEANGLTLDDIYPGQQLRIPKSEGSTKPSETLPVTTAEGTSPEALPGTAPANDGAVRYTVKPGDSLYKIAQRYWVSVEALKAANGLTGDEIYVGRVLVIPASVNRTGPSEASRQTSLTREDVDLMARVVYAEARGEIYEGQVAVAAVIQNRLKNPDFPKTIRGIVYQTYAFETVANGQINLTPNDQAYQAVQDALNGWDPSGGALYFWNPAGAANSKWIKTRTVIKQIGNHVFGI